MYKATWFTVLEKYKIYLHIHEDLFERNKKIIPFKGIAYCLRKTNSHSRHGVNFLSYNFKNVLRIWPAFMLNIVDNNHVYKI